MKTIILIFLTSASITFGVISKAEQELAVPVKATLKANVGSIGPAEPFKLGVLFEIIPGWHIYWKNSGDTGLPTKIEFELPPGFTAEGLKWPVPNIYTRDGEITDYGYENSVLLFTDVRPPEDLTANSKVDIRAKVTWVSCEEICIPGKADLVLTLPVSEKPDAAISKLFTEWESALPLESSDKNSPFEVQVKKSQEGKGEQILITLLHDGSVNVTELIPAPADNVSVSDIKIQSGGGETKTDQSSTDIELVKNVLQGSGSKNSDLELLVVYNNESEKRSGIKIILSAPDQN